MNPKVLIIGGNGFIGKNLTKFLAEKNFHLSVADYNLQNVQKFASNINFFEVNIHHTSEVLAICKNFDFIIWLVHASVPATQDYSLVDDFSLNISSIIRFFENAYRLKSLKKIIYLSSGGTVYGNVQNPVPISEDHYKRPISSYGLSKLVIEQYIEYITQESSFESIILRPSNVYGPLQNLIKPQGIIGHAFNTIKNGSKLDFYNEGRAIRDFIFVDDLATAVESCLSNNFSAGHISFYNVGSGEGFSIKQILEKIENIAGKKIELNYKNSRNFDCIYNVLDNTKLRIEKNWKADIDIDTGLQRVWDFIKIEK